MCWWRQTSSHLGICHRRSTEGKSSQCWHSISKERTFPPVPSPRAMRQFVIKDSWKCLNTYWSRLLESWGTCKHKERLLTDPTYMKSLMTRWNLEPLYPKPSSSPSLFLPVARARKFSTVLGTVYRSAQLISDWTNWMFTYTTIQAHDNYRREMKQNQGYE